MGGSVTVCLDTSNSCHSLAVSWPFVTAQSSLCKVILGRAVQRRASCDIDFETEREAGCEYFVRFAHDVGRSILDPTNIEVFSEGCHMSNVKSTAVT